jgi:hypothetical protein
MPWQKSGLLDEYDRNARLKPALLTILPASLLITALGSGYSTAIGVLMGPMTAVGFTYVLAEIGREWGKLKQPRLFALWGGKPTTVKLRHANSTINPLTLERYHMAAGRLIGKSLPTLDEENADPRAADLVYESIGDFLREKTRNKTKFPLVFKELVSYGFRRNLWGMKPFGIFVASGCIALQALILGRQVYFGNPPAPVPALLLAANIGLLLGWVFVVTPQWVRTCADAYAEQLLASCIALDPIQTLKVKVKSPRQRKPKG